MQQSEFARAEIGFPTLIGEALAPANGHAQRHMFAAHTIEPLTM